MRKLFRFASRASATGGVGCAHGPSVTQFSHSTSTDDSCDNAKESALFAIRKAVVVGSRTKLLLLLIAMAFAVVVVGVALATPGEGTVGMLLNRGSNPDEVTVHTDAIKFK